MIISAPSALPSSSMGGAGNSLLSSGFALSLLSPAVAAQSDHAQEMLSQLKLVLGRHGILDGFQLRRVKLNNLAALGTDNVIDMLVLVIVFVVGAAVAESNFARQPCVSQES